MSYEPLNAYLLQVFLVSLFVNVALTLYGVFFKPHYTKKVISLTMLSDTLNVFAVLIGYRRWTSSAHPRPPILTEEPSGEAVSKFVATAVDPLPQALVLTAIVIGLAVTLFLALLGRELYRHYGTLDMREVGRSAKHA